jgi:hypothetical protein
MGEPEEEAASTIPQTAQRLVGRYTRELSKATPLSAPGRIALSGDAAACLENCYLACLTRRPTPDERAHFLAQLRPAGWNQRKQIVEDIYWTLFNSPEFCWSH